MHLQLFFSSKNNWIAVYNRLEFDFGLPSPVIKATSKKMWRKPIFLSLATSIINQTNIIKYLHSFFCRSAFYTGVLGSHLKRVTGQFTLAGGQKDTLTLKLDASEYQDRLVDFGFVKVTATGKVQENKQSYVDEYDFQFDKPRMSVEVSDYLH